MRTKQFSIILSALIIGSLLMSCKASTKNNTDAASNNESNTEIFVSWAEGALNIPDLVAISDLVVVGEFENIADVGSVVLGEPRWGKVSLYHTDYTFAIEKVVKGDPTNSILIRQTGKTGEQELGDDPLFIPGDRYVLFLREFEPGKFSVIGGPQGRFLIRNEKIYSLNYVYPNNKIAIPEGTRINGLSKTKFIQSLTGFVQ